MGPIVLIDKSSVQALSLEDLRTMSAHYSILICPMLIQEICANLVDDKVDAETEETKAKVAYLAGKARNASHFTITNFGKIATYDLLTSAIPLEPRIPRFDGVTVKDSSGESGIFFDESEEEARMRRWEDSNFNDQDRKLAADHITYQKKYDLEESRKQMAEKFPDNAKFSSLEAVIAAIDATDAYPDQWTLIQSCETQFGATASGMEEVKKRWEKCGKPRYKQFAPYAYYCYRLASIFFIAVTSGRVPTSAKAKSVVDFQYLYYLPFSMVFCSNDKFHATFSKFFLRGDQEFLDCMVLKKDLQAIRACKSAMSEAEQKYYRENFGSYPPPMPDSITNQIWQRHMQPWKEGSGNRAGQMTEKEESALLEKIASARRDFERQRQGKA